MGIDRLELRNFKKFAEMTFEFPRSVNAAPDAGSFHVLIGENGSGKTSVLDALAVCLGVWLVRTPDSVLANSRRSIAPSEKRLELVRTGDRPQFQEAQGEVSVRAIGRIEARDGVAWEQSIGAGKKNASRSGAKEALEIVQQAYSRAQLAEHVLMPVIAYYGAGRAWLAHNERHKAKAKSNGPARRWAAFYDCLSERIRLADLAAWFQGEAIERGNRRGTWRPGFEVVRKAVLRSVPGADDVWYDSGLNEIVLSVENNAQPLSNLSAGQRTMLALVADIAIKAVTQNNFLVPPVALGPEDEPLPRVLARTPGVILIDELDVHLHPKWQRGVVGALRGLFPRVQFIVTTHSQLLLGEVERESILFLYHENEKTLSWTPDYALGLDANRVLEDIMGVEAREPATTAKLHEMAQAIDKERFADAKRLIGELEKQLGDDPELVRARALMKFLEGILPGRRILDQEANRTSSMN